jgi:hypothetical protein
MPFGGQNVTFGNGMGACLVRTTLPNGWPVLMTGTCDHADTFFFDGVNIKDSTGLCWDILFGNLTDGTRIDLTTCNGGINQVWSFTGGQIVSGNKTDGHSHCFDVQFGSMNPGAPIDIAVCNGTSAQSFWPSGPTMQFKNFLAPGDNPIPVMCLNVTGDVEASGATLDSSNCNGANGQWFVLSTRHQIQLANNTSLCLQSAGTAPSAQTITLAPCTSDNHQMWVFANGGLDQSGRPIANIVNQNNLGCVDVFAASPASGTRVETFTCNNGIAQAWQPVLSGPNRQTYYGGRVLTNPKIYQLFFGTWWNSQNGQVLMQKTKQAVQKYADFLNGVGAPAGKAPFFRQYGIVGASVAPAQNVGIADNLVHGPPLSIAGATLTNGTLHTTGISFSQTFDVGNTLTISGSVHSENNRDFIVTGVIDGQDANIALPAFSVPPNTVNETFGAGAQIQMSRAGLLSDQFSKGGSQSIEAIIMNARNAGLVPNSNDNVLIMVFPSFDFVPNTCSNSFGPPSDDPGTCDGVWMAYHSHETVNGTANAGFGVVFEREGLPNPPDLIGHEATETILSSWPETGWVFPWSQDVCDVCPMVEVDPTGHDFHICGVNNRLGDCLNGNNTCNCASASTAYITWP